MKESGSFRELLLKLIRENPGLHFREIQRRTVSAVGKLDYNLYQLEREGLISSRRDGKVLRFFSSDQDSAQDRMLAFHLRNWQSRDLLIRAADSGDAGLRIPGNSKYRKNVERMAEDGILQVSDRGDTLIISVTDRDDLLKFLKKYGDSFIDSIASSIYRLLDEH